MRGQALRFWLYRMLVVLNTMLGFVALGLNMAYFIGFDQRFFIPGLVAHFVSIVVDVLLSLNPFRSWGDSYFFLFGKTFCLMFAHFLAIIILFPASATINDRNMVHGIVMYYLSFCAITLWTVTFQHDRSRCFYPGVSSISAAFLFLLSFAVMNGLLEFYFVDATHVLTALFGTIASFVIVVRAIQSETNTSSEAACICLLTMVGIACIGLFVYAIFFEQTTSAIQWYAMIVEGVFAITCGISHCVSRCCCSPSSVVSQTHEMSQLIK